METTIIPVPGATPYGVVVGEHLLDNILAAIERLDGVQRVLVIHPAALVTTADALREAIGGLPGKQAFQAEIPDAEEAKTAQVAEFCWQVLGQAGFTRTDLVVCVGGGACTDLGGFVAATWLRGVRVIQVPTTLLAMVDAAVGGKTGINTAEGKNLVGSFHPPSAVFCDIQTLATLPANDLVAGLAEVVKCGFITDPAILDLIEKHPEQAQTPGSDVLTELIVRSIKVKADIVGTDLKEAGDREFLNYGHTFGHAIENIERYQWRHGAAVSVGMIYAAELGRLAGVTSDALVERHYRVLTKLGLPTMYRQDRWRHLHDVMRRDKKTRGDRLRFIVLSQIGRPTRLEGPDPALLTAAYAELERDPASEATR